MRADVLRATEDIDEVNLAVDVNQSAEDLLPEYLRYFRVVDRYWNDFKSRAGEVPRDVESRLSGLRLRLNAQHGDAPGLAQYLFDTFRIGNEILSPVITLTRMVSD